MTESERTDQHGQTEGQGNAEEPDPQFNVVLAEELARDDYAAAAREYQ